MKLYINNEKINPMSILKKNLSMNLQRSYITTTCNNKMLCDPVVSDKHDSLVKSDINNHFY
jgi:hypothetical protein